MLHLTKFVRKKPKKRGNVHLTKGYVGKNELESKFAKKVF